MLPQQPVAAPGCWRALPFVSDRYVNKGRHGFDGWLHTTLADPAARDRRQAGILGLLKSAAVTSLGDFLRPAADPVRGARQRTSTRTTGGCATQARGALADPARRPDGPAQRHPRADPGRRASGSPTGSWSAPGRWSPGCCSTSADDDRRRRRGVPAAAARLPRRPRRRPPRPCADAGAGAGAPRGDPRRRRVQHPAAAQALGHRAARGARAVRHRGAGATCPGVGENLQDRYEVGVVIQDAHGSSRCSRG